MNQLSSKLPKFKQHSESTWKCRCPLCGDSKKNPYKTRGNFFVSSEDNKIYYKCFNCGRSHSLYSLIKMLDAALFSQYALETMTSDTSFVIPKEVEKKEEVLTDSILEDLDCVMELAEDHPVRKYVEKRKIPLKFQERLYYVKKYKTFINSVIPNKFKSMENDHPRLFIPYFDNHGKVFCSSARAFDPKDPNKYITIKFDSSKDAIYNMDLIDYSKKIYAVEGQIDSMFLPNCIAVSGSSFINDTTQRLKSKLVLVIDNEPRNKEICNLIKKYIKENYSVCLFPRTFKFKDINEAILGGMTAEEIVKVIDENTFTGIEALIKFTEWRISNV